MKIYFMMVVIIYLFGIVTVNTFSYIIDQTYKI
jgi:hypothetical protein